MPTESRRAGIGAVLVAVLVASGCLVPTLPWGGLYSFAHAEVMEAFSSLILRRRADVDDDDALAKHEVDSSWKEIGNMLLLLMRPGETGCFY